MMFIVIFVSTWFKHNYPHEKEIKGWQLQLMFASINDLSNDVVTAISRMFQSMDDEIYVVYKERMLRHFMPPVFVVNKRIKYKLI
jgi:hypothetical protein